MSIQPVAHGIDEDKYHDGHVEDVSPAQVTDFQRGHQGGVGAHQTVGLVKSTWDELSVLRTAKVFWRSSLFAFLCFTASLFEGFMITMSGSIIVNQGFINQFGDIGPTGVPALNTAWVSAWGGVINAGQFFCGFFIPALTDRFGRKIAFYFLWLMMCAALICLCVAKTAPIWLLGKIFVGLAVGTSQIVLTPYVCEIVPVRIRGSVVMIGTIWQIVGSILVSLMLQICNQRYPLNYRLPVYIMWGPVGAILLCFLVLPESPWFYARKYNREASIKSLQALYGNVKDYDLEEEYDIILRNLEHEKNLEGEAKSVAWRDILRGINLRRLIILLVLALSQQFGGLALIGSYSTYFFALAGLADPFLASLVQTCVALAAILVYAGIIDKVGRRWPICICFTIMSIMCWIIGGVYYAGEATVHNVLLALVCIWQPCFTLVGNSYFLMASELPTAHLRIKTAAASWAITAVISVAWSFAVPPMLASLGVRSAFVFGATSIPCAVFFWIYLPETKGRSVAEVDELFEKKVPAWRWSGYVTEAERVMREAVQAQADDKGRV